MIVAREQVQEKYGIPQEEERKHLGRKRQYSRRTRMVFTGLVALAFITGVVISFYYSQVFITNFRIHSLQNQLVLLQEETDDLYSDLARLKSPDRIESIAINKLGMVKPDGSEIVRVNVGIDSEKTSTPQKTQRETAAPNEQQTHAAGQDKHWVIQSFSDLVEQVKEGVPLR